METAFQLVKQYGADFDPYVRPVTKPVAEAVEVFVDGTPALAFEIDDLTGIVTFDDAPADGAVSR